MNDKNEEQHPIQSNQDGIIKLKGFIPLDKIQQQAKKQLNQTANTSYTEMKKNVQVNNNSLNVDNKNQINNYMNPNNPKLVYDKRIFTKYQVTPQTCFYIKFGLMWLNQQNNQQMDRLLITQYDKSNSQIQCHWLKFRMWTYQESNNWKTSCMQLDQYKNYVYNKNKLFRVKIKNLLLDWSFKENDPTMRLMHVNGILSDQSIKLFMNLHPNILFHIQDKLKDILQYNL